MATLIGRASNMELVGYEYIYLAIVFFPAGCLLGFAERRSHHGFAHRFLLLSLGAVIPALLLEALLVHLSGRPVSIGGIVLSSILVIAGAFWINVDSGR